MAPEVSSGKVNDYKADIWSLGALLYQLLIGQTPFHSTFEDELKNKLNRGNYSIPSNAKLSINCVNFLDACLKIDSSQRLSFDDLQRLPFLSLND